VKVESPLAGGIDNPRVNRTLHGRSVYRPRDVRGHNVIKGYKNPGEGDGVDLFVAHGTTVRAAHAGKITRIVQPLGRLGCVYVDGGEYLTVYAHLHVRECLKVGTTISLGTILGWVNSHFIKDPHLHFEVWRKDKNGKLVSVSAGTPEGLRTKIASLFSL
jgi:murein DD-endopeptidase MepM/ murein hydrolase activator NlpD